MEQKFADKIRYKVVELSDNEESDIRKHFRECIQFLDEEIKAGRTVYVHCMAGVSRSASVMISYFMWKYNMTMVDAMAAVKEKRPCIRPNDGFLLQLIEFEKELRAEGRIK